MTLREIIFDTETTGLNPAEGHRIVEIGLVELVGRLPTGRTFQRYLNPDMEMDASAIRIHGITNESLRDKPRFAEVIDDFLAFIEGAPLVAHNAGFDMAFINAELAAISRAPLTNEIIDTLAMARQKFPGARASLDALCQRFNIDLSGRAYHGALLDARLLADVYVELTGGLQPDLLGEAATAVTAKQTAASVDLTATKEINPSRPTRAFLPSEEELAAHQAFVGKIANALWNKQP